MASRLDNCAGQATLDFSGAAPAAVPQVSQGDVERLLGALRAAGWRSAADLAQVLSWTDRKVRAVARAATPGVVSYPGSPGYKLLGDCTLEEINHTIEAFESQARDMTGRAVLYRNAYHKRSVR